MRVFKSLSLPRIVTFTANGGSSFPLSPINMLELTLPANEGGRVVTAQSRSGRLPRNPKHDFCIRWYFTEGPWGSKQQPPSTRSTPDQCCVFQKHYSGFGSCWDSCISMADSVAPCFRALTNFASALGSCYGSAQAGRVSLYSFLTGKQHLLLRLTGRARKISQPSRQNVVKPL